MGTETDQPSDRLRERANDARWKLWLLMNADRRLVAALIFGVLFVALYAGTLLYPDAAAGLRAGDAFETTFQGMLTATITGVTLVLTLNQLVLSQELGAVGDQRERMDGAVSFRSDAAELLDAPVAPARPAQFLRAFVQVAGDQARALRDSVPDDHPAADAIADLTDSLTDNAEQVASSLDGATFGEFDVVAGALDFNYSWKVFAAQRIEAEHGDTLDSETRETLSSLTETLKLFGPAREHFKTLYFQWELIHLSRSILLVSLPALGVSLFMLSAFQPSMTGDALLPVVYVGTSLLALTPFFVLLSYVLRIATVTKHTLSIGPFILRETDQVKEVEWE